MVKIDKKAIKFIEGINNLPTLPDVIVKLNMLINDPRSSASDINNAVSSDVALCSRILKIVNSSFYGFPRHIASVTHAIVILGFNTVRSIALSTFIFDKMTSKIIAPLWNHSLACGTAAKIIATRRGFEEAEESFIIGLLHDIGRVVFFIGYPDKMKKILDEKPEALSEREKEVFGVDHIQVGCALLDKWQLPEGVIEGIMYYKDPAKTDNRMASIIHLANVVVKTMEIGDSFDKKDKTPNPFALEKIGVDWDWVLSLEDEIKEKYEQANVFKE